MYCIHQDGGVCGHVNENGGEVGKIRCGNCEKRTSTLDLITKIFKEQECTLEELRGIRNLVAILISARYGGK